MPKVFVYGTLKSGACNADLLEGAKFIGAGQTACSLLMFYSGFPVVMLPQKPWDEKAAPVRGEVYEVTPEMVARLDRLESEGRMYIRQRKDIRLDDGSVVEAEMYLGAAKYWYLENRPQYTPKNDVLEWVNGERPPRSAGSPEQVDS